MTSRVSSSSERGDGRHTKSTAKLQDTLAAHDLGMTREFRREGDTAWPKLRPVGKVLLGVGGSVIDEPVIVNGALNLH